MEQRNYKALFTAASLRDRIAERLSLLLESAIGELSVCKDDLSEFVCKNCVSALPPLHCPLSMYCEVT